MKWKAQSAEEMGKENHPLMGPGGGDELPFVGEPMRDIAGQISGLAQLLDVPLCDKGGHPLASRSRHDWNGLTEKVRTWALELESARADEQWRKKAWVKKGNPYLFIKAIETMCLPT